MAIKGDQGVREQKAETLWGSEQNDGYAHIGMVLRARRLAQGWDIAQVTKNLRIRTDYLEAIETAHYKKLPGIVYAIGFVRSYADYLGLESAEIVARFKQESKSTERLPLLTLPSPAPEGRVPGSGPLLVGLVMLTVLASLWFIWRDDVSKVASMVSQIPEELLTRTMPTTGGLTQLPSKPPADPLLSTAAPANPTTSGPVPPQPPLPATIKPEQRPVILSLPSASEEADDESTPPPTALGKAPALSTDPSAEETAPPLASSLASSGGIDGLAVPPEGKIYGVQGGEARVVIRARGESWIQIRDSEGQAIFTRVLRPGDLYRAPLRPGLSLMTGNAGAIDLLVDGVSLPPLGGAGMVRRNIALDADKLRSGSLGISGG